MADIKNGEFSRTEFNHSPGQNPAVLVQFEVRHQKDPVESERQGQTVFKARDWIIITPDPKTKIERPVSDLDKRQYADKYRRWKDSQEPPVEGTPLEEWAGINRSQCEMCRSLDIRSVEQLAAVPDGTLEIMGLGARQLREQAKAYLERAQGSGQDSRLARENETLRQQLEALQTQMQELSRRMEDSGKQDQQSSGSGKRRGRPPKSEQQHEEAS